MCARNFGQSYESGGLHGELVRGARGAATPQAPDSAQSQHARGGRRDDGSRPSSGRRVGSGSRACRRRRIRAVLAAARARTAAARPGAGRERRRQRVGSRRGRPGRREDSAHLERELRRGRHEQRGRRLAQRGAGVHGYDDVRRFADDGAAQASRGRSSPPREVATHDDVAPGPAQLRRERRRHYLRAARRREAERRGRGGLVTPTPPPCAGGARAAGARTRGRGPGQDGRAVGRPSEELS